MEDFVNIELAIKLKELDFNIPFFFYYRTDDKKLYHLERSQPLLYGKDIIDNEVVIAPTIYQVLKWLREEKGLHIEIIANSDGYWYIVSLTPRRGCLNLYRCYNGGTNDAGEWDDYEQCALSAIKYILDNLI